MDPYLSPIHDRVGGAPEVLGPWQLKLMVSQGLLPHHRLLDLGCGSLRGGLHLLNYLERGRYVGLDPGRGLLAAGRRLIELAKLQHKMPHLAPLSSCDEQPSASFDFVLTQSVLNHLDAAGIEATVDRVARLMRARGAWISTGAFAPNGAGVELRKVHPTRPNEYKHSITALPWFVDLLASRQLELRWIDDHPHPRGLRVFSVQRTAAR